jgi:deoxyribonuclease V
MKIKRLHNWTIPYAEAKNLQIELAARVSVKNEVGKVSVIAGVDVSKTSDTTGRAAVVLISFPELELMDKILVDGEMIFPYIPGLLSFRELPLVLACFEKLKSAPDLVIVDGQGLAHPRGLGIASHLGLFIDIPTIGCAKSILCGEHAPVASGRGSFKDMIYNNIVIGAAVRTKHNVKPVYVSIGNRIDLPAAIRWIFDCDTGYRLPLPCRLAHMASKGIL